MKYLFTLLFILSAAFVNIYSQVNSDKSVGEVLDERGSIKPNSSGSFNTSGYTMSYGKNKQPVFNKINSPKNTETVTWGSLGKGRNGTNGTVYAMAVDDSGNIYVGGSFTLVSDIPANYIAKWNSTTSTWSTLTSSASNGVNNWVLSIAISDSDVYLGGYFTQLGDGTSANGIAKWNTTTGTWSTLMSNVSNGVNGSVAAIAINGSDVYLGGGFSKLGDNITSANHIVKFNTTTGIWSTLTCGSSNGFYSIYGPNASYVTAIAINGSDVYVGGYFTQFADGTSANYIAKWNSTTSTWSTLKSGNFNGVYGNDCYVATLAICDSNVYVGGCFYQLSDGTYANDIAKWNTITNTWSTLTAGKSNGVNGYVNALVISGSDVYVGGYITQLGDSTSANCIAKWNTSTSTWSTLTSGASNGVNDDVSAIAISGSDVYVGGAFSQLGDSTTSANYVAKWNGTWSSLGSDNNGVNGAVAAIAINGSDVYVGGSFTQLGDGTSANYIAKWNSTTSTWSTLKSGFSNGVNGSVNVLAISGNDVYIGGDFSQLGDGTSAKYITKWNTTTSTWSTLTSGTSNGVNYYVYSLAISGSDVYVGGGFTQLGDRTTSANNIAKWNSATSTWLTLTSGASNGVNGYVYAIAVSGSDVYIGGCFSLLGDRTSAKCIAKWNTITSTWSTLTSGTSNGVNGWVLGIAISGSDVYVGGQFTQLGDGTTSTNNIAKWNTPTGTWATLTSPGSNGVFGEVYAIAISGSDVYVGGQFNQLGYGTSVNNLVKWNSKTNNWSAIGNGANNWVNAMQANPTDGKMYIGGDFTTLNGTIMAYYVGTLTYDPTFIKSDLGIPSKFSLQQNYPNPFNPSTKISFSIPNREYVSLVVYNMLGQSIKTLIDGTLEAGNHIINFNGNNLASGIYLYKLSSNSSSITKKMILVK